MPWNLPRRAADIRRPLVPLSADPWTAGHRALVEATVREFGSAVVAVMTDEQRRYTLPLTLRASLVEEGIGQMGEVGDQVELITPNSPSVVDVLLDHKCGGVVRGSRCKADMEVEERRRRCSADLLPGLADRWAIWTPDDVDNLHVSATRVRDAVANGVFLPPHLASYRAQRALRYYLRGERVAVVASQRAGVAEQLCRDIADYFSWGRNPVAVHVLSLQAIRNVALLPRPAWGWESDLDGMLFRAQRAVGKARPSLRLFCAELPEGQVTQVEKRLGLGLIAGAREERPEGWVLPWLGERAVPLWRVSQGDPLLGVGELLDTFEVT